MNTKEIKLIERKMKQKRWTQADLAKAAKLSQPSISRILKGEQSNVTARTRKKIFSALGITEPSSQTNLEKIIAKQIKGLHKEDQITILRNIIRLKKSPEETAKYIKDLFKTEIEVEK